MSVSQAGYLLLYSTNQLTTLSCRSSSFCAVVALGIFHVPQGHPVAGHCLHHPHFPIHVVLQSPLCYHLLSPDHLEKKKWHRVRQKQPTIKWEGTLTRLNLTKVRAAVFSFYSGHVFLLFPWAGSNWYKTVSVYAYSLCNMRTCIEYSGMTIHVL